MKQLAKKTHSNGLEFVLAWTSGHKPPKTLFRKASAYNASTEDFNQAKRYTSKEAALEEWRGTLLFPEEYERLISSGAVRAESVQEPTFNF